MVLAIGRLPHTCSYAVNFYDFLRFSGGFTFWMLELRKVAI